MKKNKAPSYADVTWVGMADCDRAITQLTLFAFTAVIMVIMLPIWAIGAFHLLFFPEKKGAKK